MREDATTGTFRSREHMQVGRTPDFLCKCETVVPRRWKPTFKRHQNGTFLRNAAWQLGARSGLGLSGHQTTN